MNNYNDYSVIYTSGYHVVFDYHRKDASVPEKIDFKKALKQLYNPSIKGFHIVHVPAMNFLMLDGTGDPNKSTYYQLAVDALYSVAYGVKFALKPQGFDHIVPPLEGLWWMEDMSEFTVANKDRWQWTMMLMQPEWVSAGAVEKTREASHRKKPNEMLAKIKFGRYEEGESVQILYTGAYMDEAPVIAEMHRFITSNGYQAFGKHHEIYLGDPRKTSPEKLHTILRQPVRK